MHGVLGGGDGKAERMEGGREGGREEKENARHIFSFLLNLTHKDMYTFTTNRASPFVKAANAGPK